MADPLPPTPSAFKPVQHYLKTAIEHDKRDPVVAYYCRLYAMQRAMEIDRKSPECRNFLSTLMNLLEQTKKQLKDLEGIQNEVVGQAHMENYAIKLFHYADTEDRASRFGKNVVKSFYTAGMLFDVLTSFGDLPEDVERNRKYAKWKAAYIHNCLKNGETPQPGPLGDEMGEFGEGFGSETAGDPSSSRTQPGPSGNAFMPTNQIQGPTNSQPTYPSATVNSPMPNPVPPASAYPMTQPNPTPVPRNPPAGGAASLKSEDYTKAMKYCKFASSALQYEDAKTAIDNLTKALNLLTSGRE